MDYTPRSSINNHSFLFSAFEIKVFYDIHSPRCMPSFAVLRLPLERKKDFGPRPLDFFDANATLYRWVDGEIAEVNKNTYRRVSALDNAKRRDVGDSNTTERHEITERLEAKSSASVAGNPTVKIKRGLPGVVNGQTIAAVADTGAGDNIVSESYARNMKLNIAPASKSFSMGNSKLVKSIGTVTIDWWFWGEISKPIQIVCHVLSDCIYDLILGRPFLHATETFTKFRRRLKECKFRVLHSVRNLLQFGFVGYESQRLRGHLANVSETLALADSGAERNIIDHGFALARGLNINYNPKCRGYLQFADGTTQQTIGQVKSSWTFENGETIFETFEVLENCLFDVVLGEDVLYRHDVFNLHSSSLVSQEMSNSCPELAPFDYFDKLHISDYLDKLHIFKKRSKKRFKTSAQPIDYTAILAKERERQDRWNYFHDFGRGANAQQKEDEARRRASFISQNPQLQSNQARP